MKKLFFATLVVLFCGTYTVAEPTNSSGGQESTGNPGTGTEGKVGGTIPNTKESYDARTAGAKKRNRKGELKNPAPATVPDVPDTQAGGTK